jgi:hypothetical protein
MNVPILGFPDHLALLIEDRQLPHAIVLLGGFSVSLPCARSDWRLMMPFLGICRGDRCVAACNSPGRAVLNGAPGWWSLTPSQAGNARRPAGPPGATLPSPMR